MSFRIVSILLFLTMPLFSFAAIYGTGSYGSGTYFGDPAQLTPSASAGGGSNTSLTTTAISTLTATSTPSTATTTPSLLGTATSTAATTTPSSSEASPLATEEASQITSAFRFMKNLGLGMMNEDVKKLQEFLAQDPSFYPEGFITGYFGILTKAAVVRFQEKYRDDILTPYGLTHGTGFVGAKSRAKLNALLASALASSTSEELQSIEELKAKIKEIEEQIIAILTRMIADLQQQIFDTKPRLGVQ